MEESKELNLYQKLAKIKSMVDVVSKDKKGFNYTYADLNSILAKISVGMSKYHISLIPLIKPGTAVVESISTVNTKTDKTGRVYDKTTTEAQVKAEVYYKWVNNDDPEEVMFCPWFVVGKQEDPSQAFGSAMTYSMRYFLTNFFQTALATDVDEYRTNQKKAEAKEDEDVAKSIINLFDTNLKNYLIDNPDKKDVVKSFIGRYAKNANYLTIKDPNVASRLLNDFVETFTKKEEKAEK